jgi:very-short-patch-repair endonuclease
MARHARMSAHGIIVLHFPPRQIRYQRDHVANMIRRALASGRELPHIRAISSAQLLR